MVAVIGKGLMFQGTLASLDTVYTLEECFISLGMDFLTTGGHTRNTLGVHLHTPGCIFPCFWCF